MLHNRADALIFVIPKECVLLFAELGHDLSEEVQGVDLVMRVRIHAGDNTDNLFNDEWLGQDLEECFVLAEFLQNLAGTQRHVHIVGVLR